ncbi:cytochrome D1 domain-containing protein [Pseudothauera rhizosphaerae]|uniref:Protein nirF n=1 Tax=Pseudothauera rhizosphaerae TaxID=2565932 RepID=A0A4S4ADY6_9RHOO|nr:cytochrome D1 domain-containing protein [Pseudothauera rhizosphaerae]THF57227.1 protein nirF [Pseudothauera rhizosphaerae]
MRSLLLSASAVLLLSACAATPTLRGTGDLGLVIERSTGQVAVVSHTIRERLATVPGLGDLSHAHVTYSRDGRYGYVFGRDGGLTKVDLLRARIERRVVQAGNSIGGSISQDGRLVVAQNYEPGGLKVFDADTLEQLSEVPAEYAPGKRSKVVGLADLPGQRFAYALFEAGEIWVTDLSDPRAPKTERYPAGRQPYDALVTPDGRHFIAGLFGEDGLALLDLWHPERGVRKILAGYGKGEEPLPVYKMPHLRGWAVAGGYAWLPAIGRHEVLVVDTRTWQEVARVPVHSQPVFVMARPDGRQVWVNFAFPDNGTVQVIDTEAQRVVDTLKPGRAILHMEFTPRGEAVWLSARDDNKVVVYDTGTRRPLAELPADHPSGIFFTSRAVRIGF